MKDSHTNLESDRDVFDIDGSIAFQAALLSNFISRPHYEYIGDKTGMNISEWRILLVVGTRPGIGQSEIADATGLHKMTISRSLRSLKDYIRLGRHVDDGRKRVVHLSELGEALYQQTLPILRSRQEELSAVLKPAEKTALLRTLRKLIAVAQKWSEPGVSG